MKKRKTMTVGVGEFGSALFQFKDGRSITVTKEGGCIYIESSGDLLLTKDEWRCGSLYEERNKKIRKTMDNRASDIKEGLVGYNYAEEIVEGPMQIRRVKGLLVSGTNWYAIVVCGKVVLKEFDNATNSAKERSAYRRAVRWAQRNLRKDKV